MTYFMSIAVLGAAVGGVVCQRALAGKVATDEGVVAVAVLVCPISAARCRIDVE